MSDKGWIGQRGLDRVQDALFDKERGLDRVQDALFDKERGLDRVQDALCGKERGLDRVQAILFDKDGTLLDFTAMWGFWSDYALDRFRVVLKERGLELDEADISSIWGTEQNEQGCTVDYDRRGPLAMGTVEEMRAVLTWQAYRLGLTWGEAKVIVRECTEQADAELDRIRPAKLLPGVRDVLENCRRAGVPLAVVTADETDSARRHLSWLGIEDYFAVVIGTDQAERGKPYPDLCLLACERLEAAPEQVVMIGDTEGDMQMAREAGVRLKIGIGERAELPSADWTIRSFLELGLPGKGLSDESRVAE
ncbi:hypothetical protein B9G55_22540 [Saccharibacillus sp. O16]|nr:hypothetical protein B9G55_22540 [Saccharibacillus sp. O16]